MTWQDAAARRTDMGAGALEISGQGELAERNADINHRRRHSGAAGAPLKVTDPAALARVMEQMRVKAQEQKWAEQQRKEERQRREGAAYHTPEQQAADAQAREKGVLEDEARVLEKKLDPASNYYSLLGVDKCASSAELKKAYKRLALLYHPDKVKGADPEQQAAIADKFKQVAEAFDVLSNERLRAVYDKLRDYQEANPGRGLPVLTPEEASLIRSGIAELSRLRRMGTKLVKHKPLKCEVWVSLEALNGGTTKTFSVERQRVTADGSIVQQTKTLHLIVRRGSQEGDRHVFEGEGEEAVDTQPGDLVVTLRQKPHASFKRSGHKDLSMFVGSVRPGDILFAFEVITLRGQRHLLCGSAFMLAAARGGSGGVLRTALPGQGLYDPAEPWEQPAGDLHLEVRYPALSLAEAHVSSCLQLSPLYAVASASDTLSASLAAASLATELRRQQLAAELYAENVHLPGLAGCCLSLAAGGLSPAAQAATQQLQQSVPGLRMQVVVLDEALQLLDCEACALERADVLLLDLPDTGTSRCEGWSLRARLEDTGIMHILWRRAWQGCRIVAVAGACEVLGKPAGAEQGHGRSSSSAADSSPALLPWYLMRACEGAGNWGSLQDSVASSAPGTVGVALLANSSYVINPVTGAAAMVTAPPVEALAAAAQWGMQEGLEEGLNDYGFLLSCRK